MKPDHCHCGSAAVSLNSSRISGEARRRQFHCNTCGSYFATIELRVPARLDTAVFQALVRSLLKKGEQHGKAKAEEEGAAGGPLGGRHERGPEPDQHEQSTQQAPEQVAHR